MNTEQPRIQEDAEVANPLSHSDAKAGQKARPVAPPVRSFVPSRLRLQILLGFAAVIIALAALVWWSSQTPKYNQVATAPPASENQTSVPPVAEQTPLALPFPQPSVEPAIIQPENSPQPAPTIQPSSSPTVAPSGASRLQIPVAGIRSDQLLDTFQAARSEGRSHDAIDIAAPRGTPVLAAADGRIVKLWQSVPGGTTIYQLDPDNRTIYYYAHLDRYADGLAEGQVVRRGQVIAYVGDTGNAGAGNYHLHFSVSIVSDPKRYWDGTNINPYPLLRGNQ
jgi:murein DD-endopeptidase MepM/ murein hydrolase activator NlpD